MQYNISLVLLLNTPSKNQNNLIRLNKKFIKDVENTSENILIKQFSNFKLNRKLMILHFIRL